MRLPEGCAICGSTWGDYWEEVEGQRMFFCCDVCAVQFKNMIDEVKKRTGWEAIDKIRIEGDYRGRDVTALRGDGSSYRFLVRFDSKGEIQKFSVRPGYPSRSFRNRIRCISERPGETQGPKRSAGSEISQSEVS